QRKKLQRDAQKLQERIDKIEEIVPKIYEDGLTGLITRSRAHEMMQKYEAEQSGLRKQMGEMLDELESYEDKFSDLEEFTKSIAQHHELESLNATILNELISEIQVGIKEIKDGEKYQKVKIVYNQACYVEIFEDVETLPSVGVSDEELMQLIEDGRDAEYLAPIAQDMEFCMMLGYVPTAEELNNKTLESKEIPIQTS
ncbi:MAG: DUF4368 domain-containing protein, partial [Eubacteriales bacterium]